jgi:hypothetical protein
MADEPLRGEPRHLLERAGLLEEVRRARDDRELATRMDERVARGFVHLDHAVVAAADDEERRRAHFREQALAGEVRAPAARHDRADFVGHLGGDAQRRGGAGARTEQPDPQAAGRRVSAHEPHGVAEPPGQQIDVEAHLVVLILRGREEIEEERREPGVAQRFRDELVARRVAPRAAAMGEDHDPARSLGELEHALEGHLPRGNPHERLAAHHGYLPS